ncbi:MAG: sugar ABC transporter substrate-binding protein, partial [Armatimonadota bacterium]
MTMPRGSSASVSGRLSPVLWVVVAACSGCTIERVAEHDDTVTIRFSIWGTPQQVLTEQEVVAAFERSHPGIDVEIVHIPARYNDKVLTMMAGGLAPDVMMVEITPYPQFAVKGALLDLGEYVERDGLDMADFYPLALSAFSYEGSLYCLPRDISGQALYYNKSMFEQAGVGCPTAEWTWEDFRAACESLTQDTDGDGIIDQYGALFPLPHAVIWSRGGDFFDDPEHPTRCTLTEAPALEAMRWFAELYEERIVVPPEVHQDEGYYQMFATGRIGMYFDGRWRTPDFVGIDTFDWDVSVVPRGTAGRFTLHGGTCYAISSGTRHPEQAWELVRYYCSAPGVTRAIESGRTTPVLKSIALSPVFLDWRPPE